MRHFLFTLTIIFGCLNLIAQDIYKTTSDLKFRKEPNSHSHSYGLIKSGEEVAVTDKSNLEWFKIEHEGKMGYLSSKYLILVRAQEAKKVTKPVEVQQEEKSSSGIIWFIVIGALVLLYIIGKANKKAPQKNNQKEKDEERMEKIKKSIKITVGPSTDNSVIDVTGKAVKISSEAGFTQATVPIWRHQYVYSYSEINSATKVQQTFYEYFKSEFIKGNYIDLQGNLNYAFILLFDLLQEYEKHRSLSKLEQQINNLGSYYPKTKSYGINFLIERMEKAGDANGVLRLRGPEERFYYYEDWKLGNRYKDKLKLKENEVQSLNSLIDFGNKFNSIEFCAINLIKIFLETVNYIEGNFKKEGSSIKEHSNAIAVIEIAKHYRYRNGSYNYKSAYEVFINNIYQTIYKICENALRDKFNVGRKTELNWYIHSPEALGEFKIRFQSHIDKVLSECMNRLTKPDLPTEVALNEYNKTRWKVRIEELEKEFSESKLVEYVNAIYELEKANELNPSIENIFFQASKFIAKYDKIIALKFYVDYLYYDLKSVKFDNKQLTKTIQKSLFKTNEQLHDFEVIIGELVKTKDRTKALKSIESLYTPKRKKIKLDTNIIKEVHEKHSDTVELLNEYLQDEFEDEQNSIKSKEINKDEVMIEIAQKAETGAQAVSSNIGLNSNQMELLDLLSKNSFTISQQQLTAFAKSKGVLKNQLVESINESCFERLDDVLIEEDGGNYTINENYYQQIFVQ